MAGVGVESDIRDTAKLLGKMIDHVDDLSGAMESVAESIRLFVSDRFDTETDFLGNPWAELDPEYEFGDDADGNPRRKAGKILTQDGFLRNSCHADAEEDSVLFGSNMVYAATHQFGRGAIPARPFFPVTPEGDLVDDEGTPAGELAAEIDATIADWIALSDEEKARVSQR